MAGASSAAPVEPGREAACARERATFKRASPRSPGLERAEPDDVDIYVDVVSEGGSERLQKAGCKRLAAGVSTLRTRARGRGERRGLKQQARRRCMMPAAARGAPAPRSRL